MKKFKIAQIGTSQNSHGNDIWNTLKIMPDVFEVVGYVLPEREGERLADKVAKYSQLPELTLEQVLNDPTIEAVAVETDEIYCTKYALMAAQAGKHVGLTDVNYISRIFKRYYGMTVTEYKRSNQLLDKENDYV